MGLVVTLKGTFGCAAKALLLYSPFRRFLCVFVSITQINGLFEVNCLEVTKCPLMVAADQEAAYKCKTVGRYTLSGGGGGGVNKRSGPKM